MRLYPARFRVPGRWPSSGTNRRVRLSSHRTIEEVSSSGRYQPLPAGAEPERMPAFLPMPCVTRKVWVVRHGRTTGNEAGLVQGWGAYPLSQSGLAQARTQQNLWVGRNITWVISSPLRRARETAITVFGRIDELDATWVEEAVPAMSGMTLSAVAETWPELRRPDGWPREGAPYSAIQEHPDTLVQRALLAVQRASHAPGTGPVAVVTHGALVTSLTRAAGQERATVSNLAALELEVRPDCWELLAIHEPIV